MPAVGSTPLKSLFTRRQEAEQLIMFR